jgi:hypothetical protein
MPSTPSEQNQESAPKTGESTVARGPSNQAVAVADRIRPELNLEKWSIWQPSKSKNAHRARTIKREVTLANGDKATAEVEVGFTQRGVLTTEDQRTYYALIKQWEETGRPTLPTYFSLRKLAKHLQKKWGTNSIEALTRSLTRLVATPFFWKNSYFDSGRRRTIEELENFRILDKLKIIRTKTDGHITTAQGYFQFNDFILSNLLANHTKPLLLDVVLGLQSEIAQILYTYLDLILADKTSYERRSKELFDDLGLVGKQYRYPSVRKRVLNKALAELSGVPLSTGRIVSATLEKTKDEKDYKIVIRKGTRHAVIAPTTHPQEESRRGEPGKPSPKSSITIQAEQLVNYFCQLFLGVEKPFAPSTQVDKAVALIAQYGIEKARYIVEYSKKAAAETNYRPQHFGGILQYSSRAIADFERRKSQQEHSERLRMQQEERERQQREQAQAQRESDDKAEAYLEQLAPYEHQKLYDELVAEMRGKSAFLAGWEGEAFRGIIKRAMLTRARVILAKQTDQSQLPPSLTV